MNAETTKRIHCAYCGQAFDLVIEPGLGAQELLIDCEVCCRPLRVLLGEEPDDPPVVEAA